MVKNKENKDFLRKKFLSYKPDFDRDILERGLDEFEFSFCKGGDLLLEVGEICKSIFMAENSITRCYFVDHNGEEKTMWMEKEETLITEFDSFSSQTVSKCEICCYEDSPVYSIDRGKLFKLYHNYHDWALVGHQIMEEHYVKLMNFRIMISFNSASENYRHIESSFSRYLQVVPLKHLASWLNISPVHLSRIRAEKIKLDQN